MELRFAGQDSDLGALMEREMVIAQELERLRESMRLRSDKLPGAWNGALWRQGWDGTEPVEAYGA